MAKKYLIETFGCQMNIHDSERMAGLLEQAGYERASTDRDADVILINTCSVREHAEDKLYTRLGELRMLEAETHQGATIVVAGCVAQQEGQRLLKNTNGHIIDVVLGTQQQKLLPVLVERAAAARLPAVEVSPLDDVTFPFGITRRDDPVKAYVSIVEGCNDHCAFCVVPHTRGHERMRLKSEILAEVRDAVASGHREIQLLGQIVNHYQAPDDPACDFAGLLREVDAIPGVTRIRFASPHPRHTGTRLIEAIAELPRVCKHLHLPLQSGSSRILKAMRRRHTREDYLDLVDRVRDAVPGIMLSTDVIVGFPGESAADFDDTLSLVERAQFVSMFSFKYSVRPNTLAARRMVDDVSEADKTARIVELQSLQRGIQTYIHEQMIGRSFDVLIDSESRRADGELSGRTSGNVVASFARPNRPSEGVGMGDVARVTIDRAGPHSVRGHVDSTGKDGVAC
jgi:tRNA-2-methylthio-N6-dimethylallyladenosine synthase